MASLEEIDAKNKNKLSSRDRDELLKRGFTMPRPAHLEEQPKPQEQQAQEVNHEQKEQQEQQAQQTHQITSPDTPTKPEEVEKEIEIDTTPRTFLCEKCKWCDGFDPEVNEKQVCRHCKCDLIFHIDVIEEEEDDAEEFTSDDEDVWGERDDNGVGSDDD